MPNTPAPNDLYEYFVSYLLPNGNGQTFSNGTVLRSTPLTCLDEVNDMTDYLRRDLRSSTLIVLSFSLLRRVPRASLPAVLGQGRR